MNVVDQITEWARTLPPWQGEAVRRLLQQESLATEDENYLYAALKATNKLGDPAATTTRMGQVASTVYLPASTDRAVVLRRMHGLKHINALASEQSIEFALSGITVT